MTCSLCTSRAAEVVVPENTDAERIEAILNVPRATDTDAIALTDGGELRGTLRNAAFQLHTSYGSLSIEARFVAAITFSAPPQQLDCIWTVNRNRLSGFVNDEIELVTLAGVKTNLYKHQLRRVVFRLRESEAVDARSRQFVGLENGDFLSGRFKLPGILISSPGGARSVDAAGVETIRFEEATTNVHLQFRNGNEDVGQFTEPAVQMQLDCGPEITLRRDSLETLYVRSGFVPVEVRQAFGAVRSGPSKADQPKDGSAPPGLVWIPPGKSFLGSPADEGGRGSDEDPQTEVTISRGFWMGKREVTQGEFHAIMGSNPSHFQGDTNRPVEKVSWHEARAYCARLTEKARQDGSLPVGYVYRLPTEAEWEYACRAGTMTRFSCGDDPSETGLSEYAWFIGNSDMSTHPVGRLKPNPWGLFDMHGNVWEWCLDIWGSSYPGGNVTDYRGPADGWLRVARGGSWLYTGNFSRSANRDNYGPENRCSDIGFRIVLATAL